MQPIITDKPMAVTASDKDMETGSLTTWLAAWACLAIAGTGFNSHGTGMEMERNPNKKEMKYPIRIPNIPPITA
jgi:hypothetical protein